VTDYVHVYPAAELAAGAGYAGYSNTVAGRVTTVVPLETANRRRWAEIVLDDVLVVLVFPMTFAAIGDLFTVGADVTVTGRLDTSDGRRLIAASAAVSAQPAGGAL
jgi:hypothetical protein